MGSLREKGKTSMRKIAVNNPRGMEIRREPDVIIKDPNKNENPPYTSCLTSHIWPVNNSPPNVEKARVPSFVIKKIIKNKTITEKEAQRNNKISIGENFDRKKKVDRVGLLASRFILIMFLF
jgi:hypothetical protein